MKQPKIPRHRCEAMAGAIPKDLYGKGFHMHSSMVHSPLAIFGGLLAAGGATALLVKDATVTGWTVDHALMPVLVGLTCLCGHLFWRAVTDVKPISALGLALLAVLGSGLTVYETMGRRAATRDLSIAQATHSADTLARIASDHARTKSLVAEAQAWVAGECRTGNGPKCQGATFVLNQRTASLEALERQLAGAKPQPAADPKAERVAALAAVWGWNRDPVRAAVAMFEPFAFPLFLELAAIVLFGFGVGHRRRVVLAEAVLPKPMTDTEIEALRSVLAAHRRPMTNGELARRLEISKGEVSKRISKAEAAGVVRKERLGRTNAITLH